MRINDYLRSRALLARQFLKKLLFFIYFFCKKKGSFYGICVWKKEERRKSVRLRKRNVWPRVMERGRSRGSLIRLAIKLPRKAT